MSPRSGACLGTVATRSDRGAPACTLRRIALGVQLIDRDTREVRICVVAGAILVGQSFGLGLHVDRIRRLKAHAAQIEILENVEHLQGGEALSVRSHRIDIDAAVRGDQGLDPFAAMRPQILQRQPAADALEVGIDGVARSGHRRRHRGHPRRSCGRCGRGPYCERRRPRLAPCRLEHRCAARSPFPPPLSSDARRSPCFA